MLCTTCQSWEFIESDFYCSWCGATLIDLELSLDADYLYVGDIIEPLTLTIRHTGAYGTIRVDRAESNQPSWLRVKDQQLTAQPEGVALKNGAASLKLPVEVNLMALSDDYHPAKISVASSVGVRELAVEAVPKPKLGKVSTGGEHIVLLDCIMDEKLTGYFAIERGVVTIDQLSTDVDWATVEPTNQVTIPCRLDARNNNRLEFAFKIKEQLLLRKIEEGGGRVPVEPLKGNLVAKFARLEPERKWPFYVKCLLPSRLQIPTEEIGAIKIEVFTDKRGELDLTLQNGQRDEQGRAELQVQEIKIDVPWLKPTSAIAYPLTIASGQYQQVTFMVNANDVGLGSHHAKISFLTNTPGPDRQKDLYVEVLVRQMPEFDGILAIDFGTTNSCCAFIDAKGHQDFITIDDPNDNEKPTTASSTILYEDLFENGDKDYSIGELAYQRSYKDPSAFWSSVRQAKRRLGTSEPFSITFHRDPAKHADYLAREVTADILKRILERAESQLKGRISACTISHPSRYSIRQVDDLKAALVDCGIVNITTVHEPIGAALDFIQREEILENYQQYYLMVYDFGGGTTDITLMHITNQQAPNQLTEVTPVVLGTTGDPWLGGENVTDIVMKLGHEKCETVLRERYPKANTVVIPFDAENFTDPRRKSLAQQNRNTLRGWAEVSKIAISEFRDEHIDLQIQPIRGEIRLAVIVDNEVNTAAEFPHKDVVPSEAEINDKLKPLLEKTTEMMRRLSKNNGIEAPDVILLSGKSSALPIVRQIITEKFPKSEIETPFDLKQCVSRGACLLSGTDPRFGVDINLDRNGFLSATTSRLGIRVEQFGQIKFKEIVDAGVPIKAPSLKRPVEGIRLRHNSRIRILENAGLEDEMMLGAKENPNIKELKSFKLESKLIEWERTHETQISDQALSGAKIDLEVTPNLVVKLIARIPGIEEPLEFEAELVGW